MNIKQKNIVHMFPEQETASVTHLDTHMTVGQRLGKAWLSVMNVVLFSIWQIITAIASLMAPILYMIIGLWAILSYILFGIAVIALFVVDNPAEALGLMGISVSLFLLCKMLAYAAALIKIKLR